MNELFEKYPDLFSLKDNKNEPIGTYSIECEDGWFDILSSLCFMIAQHERNIEWRNKYLEKENRADEVVAYEPFKFTQIKEKFGGLTIYNDGGDEYTRGLIGMAGCWSYHICERCGAKGTVEKKGWIMTLCESCKEKK